MDYSKELARKLCEELGIEWDETATTPTIQGIAITSENFGSIFSGFSLNLENVEIKRTVDMVDLVCSEQIPIINNIHPDTKYPNIGNILLAA